MTEKGNFGTHSFKRRSKVANANPPNWPSMSLFYPRRLYMTWSSREKTGNVEADINSKRGTAVTQQLSIAIAIWEGVSKDQITRYRPLFNGSKSG